MTHWKLGILQLDMFVFTLRTIGGYCNQSYLSVNVSVWVNEFSPDFEGMFNEWLAPDDWISVILWAWVRNKTFLWREVETCNFI